MEFDLPQVSKKVEGKVGLCLQWAVLLLSREKENFVPGGKCLMTLFYIYPGKPSAALKAALE